MTLVLLVMPSDVGRAAEPSPPLADMLRAAGADQLMLTSIVLTLAVSMLWMTADLLVPIRPRWERLLRRRHRTWRSHWPR